MVSQRIKYSIIFTTGWILSLILCLLVTFTLISILVAENPPDYWVIVPFWIHIVLFLCISIAFLLFFLRKNYTAVIITIVFTVCQIICVLITSLTLISDDDVNEKTPFRKDPILWIKTHRWIPILFCIIFLPLFLAQMFLINRYAGHLGIDGGKNAQGEAQFSEPMMMHNINR